MSRKYRQPGYQDEEPRSRPAPERQHQKRQGPQGQGLGAHDAEAFRCRDCGQRNEPHSELSTGATCSKCGASLHSCVNCSRFDTSAPLECTQPIPERMRSKTKANECGFFRPKITAERRGETKPSSGRAAFDALFD